MLAGEQLPSVDFVQRKLKDIQSAHQYKFKDEDINKVRLTFIHRNHCHRHY